MAASAGSSLTGALRTGWASLVQRRAERADFGRPIFDAGLFALELICAEETIEELRFLPPQSGRPARTALEREALGQLQAWLKDAMLRFDLPLAERGSAFQRQVWAAIAAIPFGQTRRYGELAQQLSSASRAVGGACRANPWPLIVPCHRVVAQNALGGFAGHRDGWLPAVKRWLLAREGS